MAYLDHAATTALRPEARDAWLAAHEVVGNAASIHGAGRAARRILAESREQIAADLAVAPSSVVFTSGGTEADNLAVSGGFAARHGDDPQRRVIVLSRIEHKAVSEPATVLQESDAELEWLDVDSTGSVDPDQVRSILRHRGDQVALVALMWANNEVGAVQSVAEIGRLCREAGVQLHSDAVQAIGNVAVQADAVGTLALSAHKVGGPKGIGVLVVDPTASVDPLLRGGGQESGLRAGTVDVPGAAAAAAAIHEAVLHQPGHAARVRTLRDQLLQGLREMPEQSGEPGVVVNSTEAGLPGLVSVSFPGCDADALMMLLDSAGIAVSTGSACSVGIPKPSYVLAAMGSEYPGSTLRFSLGWNSTADDVRAALAALPEAVERTRRATALSGSRS